MQLSSLIGAIRLIQMGDKRWIPQQLRGYSFFSKLDEWGFQSSEHQNMCITCEDFNGQVFAGDELRRTFPYLTVESKNTISPNVHPNCKCTLQREN
ncbi:MAG: hypothetical protein FWD52_00355 [Candidatus Bathyarchaeota archaeon]|nr:hypothetical protein [Candidatus Termiticorpusculum sp.]